MAKTKSKAIQEATDSSVAENTQDQTLSQEDANSLVNLSEQVEAAAPKEPEFNCGNCQGTGLKDQYNVCGACNGTGKEPK